MNDIRVAQLQSGRHLLGHVCFLRFPPT